ncbi:hypothetical protein VT84_07325 [Gemmata sp. SH-PL17]|nr:hypothetical protein VT84_07325 [Gemmata sp. SH-PL17]
MPFTISQKRATEARKVRAGRVIAGTSVPLREGAFPVPGRGREPRTSPHTAVNDTGRDRSAVREVIPGIHRNKPQLSEEIKVYIGLGDQVYAEPPRKRAGGRDQVYVTGATRCAGITPERDQVYVDNWRCISFLKFCYF